MNSEVNSSFPQVLTRYQEEVAQLRGEHAALIASLRVLSSAIINKSSTVPYHALNARDLLRRIEARKKGAPS